MRVLAERFSLIEKIRYEAASREEEDMARDPSAIMTRDQYPVSCWQVRTKALFSNVLRRMIRQKQQ